MGYTHYFELKRAIPLHTWSRICADVRTLLGETEIPLEGSVPGEKPEVTVSRIWINGVDDGQYEDFVLTRDNASWQFCKTALKPYDRIVCAVLAVVQGHAGADVLEVTSDGDSKDWDPALAWASDILGREIARPPGVRERASA